MNFISIIVAILVFGFLIFIHELGHFIAARKSGIKVLEFAIGMGPILYKKEKNNTVYSFRAVPIGGFCQMLGEDEELRAEGAFSSSSKLSRFIVLVAGSFMNLIAGFAILVIITAFSQNVPTTDVAQFREGEKPSVEAGLEVGDRVIGLDKTRVNIASDISTFILRCKGEPADITVIRDGEKLVLQNVVFPYMEIPREEITGNYADKGKIEKIYYSDFYVATESPNFLNVPRQAFFESISIVKSVWLALFDLVTGNVPVTDVSGPVGVTDYIGTASKQGLSTLLMLVVFITINLGVVNLLPLPALDGGRIAFLLVETIIGRPVPTKYEALIHFAGFLILIAFSIYITYNDILKLINR